MVSSALSHFTGRCSDPSWRQQLLHRVPVLWKTGTHHALRLGWAWQCKTCCWNRPWLSHAPQLLDWRRTHQLYKSNAEWSIHAVTPGWDVPPHARPAWPYQGGKYTKRPSLLISNKIMSVSAFFYLLWSTPIKWSKLNVSSSLILVPPETLIQEQEVSMPTSGAFITHVVNKSQEKFWN